MRDAEEKIVNIASLIAPSFDSIFFDVQRHKYTHYWLAGGRGSTKSSFASLNIPLTILQRPDCHAVVLRKVANTLRNSVYNQVEWAIHALGVAEIFDRRINPLSFTHKKTGQKILFLGVDDKEKIKSLKLPLGYVGIIWFEELDQFSGMEEIRSLLQSLLRGGDKYWVFYSFNPPKSRNNWVNEEVMFDRVDRIVHQSTYLDVPRSWLGEQFILEAKRLKEKSETLYRHEYLGEVTGTGGSVFDNVEDRKMSDEEIASFDRLHYGLDFGYAIDPLAFICMHYDKKREDLYIFDEIYSQRLKNKQAAELIKPKTGRRMIGADSAEPRTIDEMTDYGLNILPSKKGPDSVDYGIKWLQRLDHIYIDKRRAPNTYREFIGYEYRKNKDGQYISAYPDKNNHAIDAVRYGIENDMLTATAPIFGRHKLY